MGNLWAPLHARHQKGVTLDSDVLYNSFSVHVGWGLCLDSYVAHMAKVSNPCFSLVQLASIQIFQKEVRNLETRVLKVYRHTIKCIKYILCYACHLSYLRIYGVISKGKIL